MQYYINYIYVALCTILAGGIIYFICKPFGYKFVDMCIRIIICILVTNLIFYLLNYKRPQFQAVIRLKRLVLKNKN